MATIVLVHGIAQEQLSADSLEAKWLPALAGGLRNSGHDALADQIWRNSRPGAFTTRMAFYGDLYMHPGAQGGLDAVTDLDAEEMALADELAAAWLSNAARYAADGRDRANASRDLTLSAIEPAGAQGFAAALRPTVNALTRLRWFAPLGIGLAGRFVNRALTQVTRYLLNEHIRTTAQDRVLAHIGPDTRLVIAHSLGTVVAYEALHRTSQPTALLTLGSPLGLRTIVYDRLVPQPPHVPRAVTGWNNLVDRDDLVAAHLELAPYFPPAPGSAIAPTTPPPVDNGAQPHEATHYLNKSAVGDITASALTSHTAPHVR